LTGTNHSPPFSCPLTRNDFHNRMAAGLRSFSKYAPLWTVRTLLRNNTEAVLGVEEIEATMFCNGKNLSIIFSVFAHITNFSF
jgi:hypothetical protein